MWKCDLGRAPPHEWVGLAAVGRATLCWLRAEQDFHNFTSYNHLRLKNKSQHRILLHCVAFVASGPIRCGTGAECSSE
jgi:hypothetical protein